MNGILLINMDYTPLRVLSLKRALSLIFNGKAEIVESYPNKKLRSPSITMDFPAVMRLKRYVNVPRRNAVYSRRAVFTRDHYTCVYCGKKLGQKDATVDHLIPVSECKERHIRASSFMNCVTACQPCNTRKGSRSLADSGMKFFDRGYIAKTPRTSYVVMSGEIPSSWRKYIEV